MKKLSLVITLVGFFAACASISVGHSKSSLISSKGQPKEKRFIGDVEVYVYPSEAGCQDHYYIKNGKIINHKKHCQPF